METENINNYSEMSIEDLEKLIIKFVLMRTGIKTYGFGRILIFE